MMNNIRKYAIILFVLGWVLGISSCRKQYKATEQDMANYGWFLFEKAATNSDYISSKSWFSKSIIEDSTYMDGYNGLGWSFGKLTDLDSSIYYFEKGLRFTPSIFDTTNIRYEIWAGLCFASNAIGQDSFAIIWGDSLIDALTGGLTSTAWIFSHNNTISNNKINHLDLRITMAASHFAEGEFSNSVTQMQTILTELSSTSTFNPDVNSVSGRSELAFWIDSLQTILSTQ